MCGYGSAVRKHRLPAGSGITADQFFVFTVGLVNFRSTRFLLTVFAQGKSRHACR
jgi:hypothetical protein